MVARAVVVGPETIDRVRDIRERLSAANANSPFVDDPQLTDQFLGVKLREQTPKDVQHMLFVLSGEPQYDDPTEVLWRVRADVGEVQIECEQGAPFALADGGDATVRRTH